MVWYSYPYNYSNGTAVSGAGDFFFDYTSSISDGGFGMGIILLIWMTIFGISSAFGSKKAMAVASFISFFLSLPLILGGWLNPIIPIVLIILGIIGGLGSKEEGL